MKKTLIGLIILGFTLICHFEYGQLSEKNGKLSGIVTYKDSYELPKQADAGCEIYLISEASMKSTRFASMTWIIESFQINKSEYAISVNNTVDPVKIRNARDNFDTVAKFTAKYINGFKQLPAIVRISTNGTGNYSLNLTPGKYYILFISGNVKNNNMAEEKGNVVYELVDIKPAKETMHDVSFMKNDMLWIRYATRRQLQGC
jgi:hypothetical protein